MDKIISSLNKKGFFSILKAPTKYHRHYNCWGFTAHAYGWYKKLIWLEDMSEEKYLKQATRIDKLLKKNTVVIDKPQKGDIVVFRDIVGISHTATLISKTKIIHKPGARYLEVTTLKKCIRQNPCYGKITEYRRLKEFT